MATEYQHKRKFQDFEDDDEDIGYGQEPDSMVTDVPLSPFADSPPPPQQLDGWLDCFEEEGGCIDEDMLDIVYPDLNGDGSGSPLSELDDCIGDFALSVDADGADYEFETTNAATLDAEVDVLPPYYPHCDDGPWLDGVDGADEPPPGTPHEEDVVQRIHSAIEGSSAAGKERSASEPVHEQPRTASATSGGGSQRRSLRAVSLDNSRCVHDGPAATLRQQSVERRRNTVSQPRSSTTSSTTPAGSDQVQSPSSGAESGRKRGPCVNCFIRCRRNRSQDCVMVKSVSTAGKVACQACATGKTQCEPMPEELVSDIEKFWAQKTTMYNTHFSECYEALRKRITHVEPTTRQGMERQMCEKLYLIASRLLEAQQRVRRVGRVWDSVAGTSNAASSSRRRERR